MSNQYYDGNVTFEYDDKQYEATVHATATYTFTKGRMYMPNGDPGYPDEEDFEVDDIDVEAVFRDGVEVPYVDDMEECIAEALEDVDWEYDEYDPPEPEDDWMDEDEAYERCYGNG